MEHLRLATKYFGENKDRAFESKVGSSGICWLLTMAQMAEDGQRLLSLQLAYERELEQKFQFAGFSVNDFISKLLQEGFGKRAEKVRVDWKVPDKRYTLFSCCG